MTEKERTALIALARILDSPFEPDKWRDFAERAAAYMLDFEGEVSIKDMRTSLKPYQTLPTESLPVVSHYRASE